MRKLAILLSIFMLITMLGCSNSNIKKGNATGDVTKVSQAQGVTDTEILVCNSAAVSGAFATVGVPWKAGIQAYFDMVNAKGGIDGRLIKFIHIDDEFDPIKAKAAYQTFVEDEKVFAYVGHFGSPVIAATIDDIRANGIPAVYFGSGIGQLYVENAKTIEEGLRCFPVQPIYITEGKVMTARAVSGFGAKKIGVIYTSDDAGMDMLEGIAELCNELRIELYKEQVAVGTPDASAAVTSIKNKNVDMVVVASIQATMPTIVKELAAQSVNKPAITSYVNTSITIAKQVSEDIKGKFQLYSSGWLSYEGEFAKTLEEASKWLGEYSMNSYAHCGWTAAHFFTEGLRRMEGQPITWEAYTAAMESAPVRIPFGGNVDYSNGMRTGTQSMSLYEIDMTSNTGWTETDGLKSIDELLSQ